MQTLEADTYRQLIDSLGDRQRTIMKLRCEWGLSPTEIQDALGISRKAYENQLTRAFKRVAAGAGEIEDGSWFERQRECRVVEELLNRGGIGAYARSVNRA